MDTESVCPVTINYIFIDKEELTMQTKRLMAFALAAAMTTSASTPVSALAAETPENVGGYNANRDRTI